MQRIEILMVTVVFVESKHILPKDITNVVKEYFFAHLPIAKGEKDTIRKIFSFIYKDNMQIRKKRDLSTFYKLNIPFL